MNTTEVLHKKTSFKIWLCWQFEQIKSDLHFKNLQKR